MSWPPNRTWLSSHTAITVSVLALVQRLADFQNKPLAAILMAGVVTSWGIISVVEFAVHNALNLKIAKQIKPAGYGGLELMLHRTPKVER